MRRLAVPALFLTVTVLVVVGGTWDDLATWKRVFLVVSLVGLGVLAVVTTPREERRIRE